MRALIQRVNHASVDVEDRRIGEISKGLLILLGIEEKDEDKDLQYIVKKCLALRIFPDQEGKMNLSVQDIGGELLVVSQFTLIADTEKGNRPSFFRAAKPEKAKQMYEAALAAFRTSNLKLECGQFAADMQVSLENNGPVTIVLDSCT